MLKARVHDASKPITIDTFRTVLSHRALALDYEGLTFKDIASSELAKRRVVDVQYRVPDTLTATSDSIVDIPPAKNDSGPYYTAQHTFQTPEPRASSSLEQPTFSSSGDPEMRVIVEDLVSTISDQTVGLEVGRTYEIGLGNDMNRVSWWRPGSKAEVFARGPVRRRAEGPELELELVRTATFTVVE